MKKRVNRDESTEDRKEFWEAMESIASRARKEPRIVARKESRIVDGDVRGKIIDGSVEAKKAAASSKQERRTKHE